jgi:creatinine amidohydrolase/Fe(II)-dependent formamide hydrolase-like protein
MSGRIFRLEEISSTAFADLDKERTALFIPVSPIEGHGSHLPLGVDFYDALFFAEKAAETTLAKKPDFDMVICPGIPIGTQVYRQPGSLRIDQISVYRIAYGLGASLATWGFRFIFLLSGHGSPRDIVALESACKKVSRKFKVQMHDLSGALAVRFLSGEFVEEISANLRRPLTGEEKELLKTDIHGGWWETSMMLLLKPELVNDGFKDLPDTLKGEQGQKPGYYGSPSRANVEFAEASVRAIVEEAGQIIVDCLSGRDVSRQTTSPLYGILPLRPYFRRYIVLALIALLVLVCILLATAILR